MRAIIHHLLNTLVLRCGAVPILGRACWWMFAQWQRAL